MVNVSDVRNLSQRSSGQAGAEPHRSERLLEVSNLSIEYATAGLPVRAVEDVSMTIRRGEIYGLAGESGSGKSTVAYGLLRLLRPPAVITGGQVLLEGEDVLAMNEARLRSLRWRRMALVFQSAMNALNPVLTIGEQLADVIQAHLRVKRAQAWERGAVLLEKVGIESSRLRSFPHQLSGGMRQRVVIAMALALEPPLIIMDEPTTALDVVVQEEILEEIRVLKEELGLAILFITHDLSLLLEFSNRVGIMYAGELVETAPTEELMRRPEHPYTRGLLDSFPSVKGKRKALTGIGGMPPDMRQVPAGCRFHPRCSLAVGRCSLSTPRLTEMRPNHQVACDEIRASSLVSERQSQAANAPSEVSAAGGGVSA